MSPPQLARDTPVLDIFHPVVIGFAPVVRDKTDAAVFDRFDRRFCQGFGAHEPLIGQIGFDDHPRAVAVRAFVNMLLGLDQQTRGIEILDNLVARREAVHTLVSGRRVLIHDRIDSEQVDHFHFVALPDFVVIEVMRGRDLDAAGSEFGIDIFVDDDRDDTGRHRHLHSFADEITVALIVLTDRERTVRQYGFRPGGGNLQVCHAFDRAVHQRVTYVVEETFFFFVDDFEIGDRGMQNRVPVDQAFTAVNQVFFVEFDEHFLDRGGKAFVHGESFARPVGGGAHAS